MKKTLSLILAVLMLLGCMSVTAFAEETDNSTDITLTVAKALTYDMVIPEDVTNLNAAGVFEVGQAKVENVKNATDKTVISYTAETTAFKCEGKTDIPASYYTDLQGTNTFPTTAVEVYKNKADAASIPAMYVGISESDFNAAENGTYTATVTFNFSTKEVTPVTAADALVENAYFKLNFTTTQPYNGTFALSMTYHKTASGFEATELLIGNDDLLEYADGYPANADGSIITVSLNAWEFPLTFTLDTSTNVYSFTGDNNQVTFTSFSVKPAGATEFTEITLMPKKTEIFNILATAEGGFPTANDASAWVSETGAKCWGIYSESPEDMCFILLKFEKDDRSQDIGTGGKKGMATWQDGNYVHVKNNLTYTFVMDNGKLTAITFDNSDDVSGLLNGTYTAPAALGETYTVTFDTQGHSFPPLPLTGVISGSTISAPIAPPLDAGYTFDGWYKEAACTNAWNFDTDTVTADTTLYAKWTEWGM